VGGTLNQGFAYDDAGNPTTLRGVSSIPYNRNNQRTGSETYTYDGNGNPITYKGTALTFDVENRMTAYGSAMTAGYDGVGLRAWKTAGGTTTYFLYDGTNLLCELNASGTVLATNTWGANGLVSRRVGTTSTFYVYDPQGSVAQRLDGSGNVVSSDLYDAYGARKYGTSNDPYGYCGQWGYYTDAESAGLFGNGSAPLILCTHRYYDPANGRWLTRDPIDYAGGINLYGYVGGDPVDGSDPNGLQFNLPPDGVVSVWGKRAKCYEECYTHCSDVDHGIVYAVCGFLGALLGSKIGNGNLGAFVGGVGAMLNCKATCRMNCDAKYPLPPPPCWGLDPRSCHYRRPGK
jgi:RHS repeat-associated protein